MTGYVDQVLARIVELVTTAPSPITRDRLCGQLAVDFQMHPKRAQTYVDQAVNLGMIEHPRIGHYWTWIAHRPEPIAAPRISEVPRAAEAPVPKPEPERKWACSWCKEAFVTWPELERHRATCAKAPSRPARAPQPAQGTRVVQDVHPPAARRLMRLAGHEARRVPYVVRCSGCGLTRGIPRRGAAWATLAAATRLHEGRHEWEDVTSTYDHQLHGPNGPEAPTPNVRETRSPSAEAGVRADRDREVPGVEREPSSGPASSASDERIRDGSGVDT